MCLRPSLKHQRPQDEHKEEFDGIEAWYTRGQVKNTNIRKYREGACENCGAMTHKKKDCLEVREMKREIEREIQRETETERDEERDTERQRE